MNTKAQQGKDNKTRDTALLILAGAIFIASIVADVWLGKGSVASPLRLIGLIVGLVAALGVGALTDVGRRVRHFISESQFEVRKVTWPTREETIKTTGIIIVVTILLSLLLGLIDLTLKSVILDWLLKLG